MEVKAVEMREAGDLVGLVPARSGVASSNFVGLCLSGPLRLRLSTGDIWAEAVIGKKLRDEGEFLAVNRNAFMAFIAAGTDADYTMMAKDGAVLIRQEKRKVSLQVAVEGPVSWAFSGGLEEERKSTALDQEFRDTIVCARLCASEDMVLPEINCIWIEPGKKTYVFSSNDAALCFAHVGQEWAEPAALPLSLAEIICKLESETLIRCGESFGIESERGSVWAQAPEAAWEFPAKRVKDLVMAARKEKGGVELAVAEFAAYAQTFAVYLSGTNKADAELRMDWKKKSKSMGLTAQAGVFAEFNDVLGFDAEAEADGSLLLGLVELGKILGFLKGRDEKIVLTPVGKVVHLKAGRFEFILSQRIPRSITPEI